MAKQVSVGRRRSGRPGSGKKPLGIIAVDQALHLLNEIAARPEPQSLMQLAQHHGMGPSKVHRYLVSLCRSGLVAKADAGLYELGPRAMELGGLALAKLDELAHMESLLGELVAQLNESAFLYVWTSSGPVMIRSRRPAYTAVVLRIGTVAPLIGSASGPVFVAFLPPADTKPLIARDALAVGVDPVEAARVLAEDIVPRIRAEKVYVSETTLIPNSRACAAPVFDAQGDLLYVIGVSLRWIGAAMTADQIAETVCGIGREMSRRMGHYTAP